MEEKKGNECKVFRIEEIRRISKLSIMSTLSALNICEYPSALTHLISDSIEYAIQHHDVYNQIGVIDKEKIRIEDELSQNNLKNRKYTKNQNMNTVSGNNAQSVNN